MQQKRVWAYFYNISLQRKKKHKLHQNCNKENNCYSCLFLVPQCCPCLMSYLAPHLVLAGLCHLPILHPVHPLLHWTLKVCFDLCHHRLTQNQVCLNLTVVKRYSIKSAILSERLTTVFQELSSSHFTQNITSFLLLKIIKNGVGIHPACSCLSQPICLMLLAKSSSLSLIILSFLPFRIAVFLFFNIFNRKYGLIPHLVCLLSSMFHP